MGIKYILLFLMCISSNFSAFGQNERITIDDQSNEAWTIKKGSNFTIEYPADWEITEPGPMGTTFVLKSPIESDQDQFQENVNLMIQDLSDYKLDLDQYVAISEEQIKTLITDGKILDSQRMSTDNGEFQKVVFTGRQGIYELKFQQFYWIVNSNAYVLTLTCEETEFEKYIEVGNGILSSFEVK